MRSLRGRVAALALGTIALALLAVGAFVYVSLDHRLHTDLERRVAFRAQLAERLAPDVSDQTLADRLAGDGVDVVLSRGGAVVATARPVPDPTLGRPKPKAPPPPAAGVPTPAPAAAAGLPSLGRDAITVDQRLPGGTTLTLRASTAQVDRTLSRLLLLEIVGSLVALLLAALALWRFVGFALRPLDAMTGLALRTARGGAGERLAPARTDSELGRAAAAFDEMLDAQEQAVADARASEERMRTFVADAGHELRTPLAGLQLSADQLLRGVEDDARREELALRVVRETRRAGRLVSDLLDTARLGTAPELHRVATPLGPLVREELDRFGSAHPDVTITAALDARGPEREATTATIDAPRVGQVIANLLDNARHAAGANGTIAVTLAVEGDRVRLAVEDDGAGVAADDRDRIFDRLVRLDTGRSRDRFGSGLGLTIARAIAVAHGGTLHCEASRVLGGARFLLELPLRVPTEHHEGAEAAPQPPHRPSRVTPEPAALWDLAPAPRAPRG